MDNKLSEQELQKDSYYKENEDIIKFILNERFFKQFKKNSFIRKNGLDNNIIQGLSHSSTRVEIYITSLCNQKCTYCYLVKYEQLYPKELNKKQQILKNFKILLNYFIESDFNIGSMDLFSGEIWHSEFGLEILEILYNAIQSGLRVNEILIPSNCSFIRNTDQKYKIQEYLNKFRAINCNLMFSISIDGAPIENISRPLNSGGQKQDSFYEDLFIWAKENGFLFHPMVAASNVKYWIANYEWWLQKCFDYDLDIENAVMMLEVRNDDWTRESINDYFKFLDFGIEQYIVNRCNNNPSLFLDAVYKGILPGADNNFYISCYTPWLLTRSYNYPACTISNTLTIRLGDLAICPCHRTAYDKFLYGKFIVENDKIINIKGNNSYFPMRALLLNEKLCGLGCDTCYANTFCLRGCYGSQYEATKDPFTPIESVCKFFKGKYLHLALKYRNEFDLENYLNTFIHQPVTDTNEIYKILPGIVSLFSVLDTNNLKTDSDILNYLFKEEKVVNNKGD